MTLELLEPIVAEGPATLLPYLVLEDVSWDLYEQLLQTTDGQHLQLTFDRGNLEIMSPLPEHEQPKKLIDLFISIFAMERAISMRRLGSTTFREKRLDRGLEPDECYYIQNEALLRTKRKIDLKVDPPPDLVIEIDITSRSVPRQPIYAAMGVREIWRHDGLKLQMLELVDGRYQPIESSRAFPLLSALDINRFLNLWADTEETAVAIAFRDWVRTL